MFAPPPASAETSLDFSPDGAILASGSIDGDIILWDTQIWRQIGEPLDGYGAVWGLAFSPDGSALFSGGNTGSVYVRDRSAWSSDLSFLAERLCVVAGRNLTQTEWKKFLPGDQYRPTCPGWPIGR